MLKSTARTICKPLCILFNLSLNSCAYPDSWKSANVMPLFKKGERNVTSNYRPISLISCVGKVMERIVFKHVYNHLYFNNLIYRNQAGFLPGHSTVYQLIDIYNQICKSFDEKKSTCMVFCDISKAFDKVWHRGLLFKIKQLGISGQLLAWLSNYLTNRKQRVFVNASFSNETCLNAGVPQGSVLGPLLFLIYVNDIAENLISLTRLFADDSSLSVSSEDTNLIEQILNTDLREISTWAKQWLVDFNPNKTEVVFFSLVCRNRPTLFFQNSQLNFVEHHKHLGVTLSQDGTWHEHITNIISSASKVLGSMKMLKFKLKRKTLNQIYLSYLRPILEYASVVWDSCTLYEQDILEKIQYEAARIVTGLTRSVSIERLIKEVGWVSLADRRKIQKLTLIYNYHNGNLPIYLNEIIPPNSYETHSYNLRNSNNLSVIARRTEIFARSVIPSAVKLWNELDLSIRNSPSLHCFKIKMKNLYRAPSVPTYYLDGERLYSLHHARIRNHCSNLHGDLYHNFIRSTPSCDCGNKFEDAEHYILNCYRYETQRQNFFRATRIFHPLNIDDLLFGNPNLTDEENSFIFLELQNFIKQTGRFGN
jgi:Reverse transcriptase (RNA-dependent DNA polymerase)